MKKVIQLKIDISVDEEREDEIVELYSEIGNLVENAFFDPKLEIMDDGHAPYTEDVTEQYRKLGGIE